MNLIQKFFAWDGLFPDERGFVQAALMAAPYILSALGGIFGKKKKYMDPEEYQRRFGGKALADETQQIANFILNSPYGQQLLTSAAEGGQQFERDTAARAAASGMGPGTGAESGASIFASGAAGQASNALRTGVKADVLKTALPIAAQNVRGYGQLALSNLAEQNQEPSTFQKIAAAGGQLAGTGPFVAPSTITKPGEETADDVINAIRKGYTL